MHINTEPGWRGGEQQTLYLAQGVAAVRPTIVVARAGSEMYRRAEEASIEVASVPSDRGIIGIRALRKLIRKTKPAVVHAHASKAHQLARLALWGTCVPLVVTRRVEFPLKRSLWTKWKYGMGVAAFGAISNAVQMALESGGVEPRRIHVIPSAADFNEIEQTQAASLAELRLPKDAFVVLHVGALNPQKNQEMLLRVWAALNRAEPRAHLLIAGDGELRDSLRLMASKLDLDRVHWLGFRRDVVGLMKRADMFLNTSRFEGLCSSLIQVRRCGVPIVATAVGGVPDVVEDEVSGILTPLDDDQAMVEAALRVIGDRKMDRIRAGVREGMDHFSVQHMAGAYLRLYEEVCANQ